MALYRSSTGSLFYLEGDPDPSLVNPDLTRLSAEEEAARIPNLAALEAADLATEEEPE